MTKEEQDRILWEAGHRDLHAKGRLLYEYGRVERAGKGQWSVLGIHSYYLVSWRVAAPGYRQCTCRGYAIRQDCSHISAAHFLEANL